VNPAPAPRSNADWKSLYRAAMLETEKSVVKQKISLAVTAVLARQKELFLCRNNGEKNGEKEDLEEALYRLRAYRNAWESAELTAGDNARAAA
jgi:hypothetical protein